MNIKSDRIAVTELAKLYVGPPKVNRTVEKVKKVALAFTNESEQSIPGSRLSSGISLAEAKRLAETAGNTPIINLFEELANIDSKKRKLLAGRSICGCTDKNTMLVDSSKTVVQNNWTHSGHDGPNTPRTRCWYICYNISRVFATEQAHNNHVAQNTV
jgi:hypothetical protein